MKTMSGGRQWVYLVVFFIGAVLAASASSASATGTVGEVARGGSDGDSSASYDGRQIDLKRSWEGAGLEVAFEPRDLRIIDALGVQHHHVHVAPVERIPALAPIRAAILEQGKHLSKRLCVGGAVVVVPRGDEERNSGQKRIWRDRPPYALSTRF